MIRAILSVPEFQDLGILVGSNRFVKSPLTRWQPSFGFIQESIVCTYPPKPLLINGIPSIEGHGIVDTL